jgi:hypothetical protein
MIRITSFRYRKDKPNWYLVEWKCCGLLWQLIITPAFKKERENWNPTCPICGENTKGGDEYERRRETFNKNTKRTFL